MSFSELVQKQKDYVQSHFPVDYDSRAKKLCKMREVIQKNESKFVQALKDDLGKSELEAFVSEIGAVYDEIGHILKNLKSWMRPERKSGPLFLMPSSSSVIREPMGSVLVMAPWNYPFLLTVSPVIGALAAGNSVVLKPSEAAPATQQALIDVFNTEFEEDVLHVVGGAIPECEELLREKFDFIFFTGSAGVGKIVMRAASEHLTPVCLELGGKSPCIIDETVNLDHTAKRIVWGKFFNAGQTCVAPDYVYVPKAREEEFLGLMKKWIIEFYGENPKDSKDLGRIIHQRHLNRLHGMIDLEKVYFGGDVDVDKKYMSPTILRGVTWDDKVMSEEIFGPILPVLVYENLDEVFERVRAYEKPLALYVFAGNDSFREKVSLELSFGGGCANDCLVHLANHNLPFGGVGNSGMGSYHGKHSFELFSHKKSWSQRSFFGDVPLRYPKYSEAKLKWLRRLISG